MDTDATILSFPAPEQAPVLRGERLDLVPGTLEMLRAELASRGALAQLLGAHVPGNWPPELYDASAIEYAIRQLEGNSAIAAWSFYYFVLRDADGARVAVGVGGFKGEPTADGTVEIGYSILPDYQRRGLATEAVRTFLDTAFRSPIVRRVVAETLPELVPSIGVLLKSGLRFIGDGAETGTIRYEITREEHEADMHNAEQRSRRGARVALADALEQLARAEPERRSVELFRHGTLSVKLYAPRGRDEQTPHEQDEVYIVASGNGLFFDGAERLRFGVGDVLFAPAGVPHRFEDFTDDLAVWVLFYGPPGGETNA